MKGPNPGDQDQKSLRRARLALRCLPFRLAFYRQLEQTAISSTQLATSSDWPRLSRHRLGWRRCEDHFVWLIQLGVLRREVDGQGLTERVRLTPMGREVLALWQGEIPAAGLLLGLQGWLGRHRPRL